MNKPSADINHDVMNVPWPFKSQTARQLVRAFAPAAAMAATYGMTHGKPLWVAGAMAVGTGLSWFDSYRASDDVRQTMADITAVNVATSIIGSAFLDQNMLGATMLGIASTGLGYPVYLAAVALEIRSSLRQNLMLQAKAQNRETDYTVPNADM